MNIYEFRIIYDYAHLLFAAEEGKNIGTSVKAIQLAKDDPRFLKIKEIRDDLKREGKVFFGSWRIIREYAKGEIDGALLFHMRINKAFEPTGEQCGTIYNESTSCKICGANAKQVGSLKLKKKSIVSGC